MRRTILWQKVSLLEVVSCKDSKENQVFLLYLFILEMQFAKVKTWLLVTIMIFYVNTFFKFEKYRNNTHEQRNEKCP